MNGKTILAAVVLGLVANTAIAQSTAGGGSAGASSGASSGGGADATAPAGAATGVPRQGPSGTLLPPPQITNPASPGTFSPGSRDGGGVPAGAGGAAGGRQSTRPGSGIGGVLSPSAQTSMSVNATTFRSLDSDGDSGLSRGELSDPELLRHFSRLDRNSDGRLSEQEYLLFGRDPDTR